MDVSLLIPADDSVRYSASCLKGCTIENCTRRTPGWGESSSHRRVYLRFRILVYGYKNGSNSSRKLEQACLRDVNFMYLLRGAKAPDHATIARFRNARLTDVVEDLFS